MSPGILVKYIRSLMAIRSICRRMERIDPNQCLILTYHRVLPKGEVGPWVEPGMYVTPDVLRTHIRFLKRFFEIIDVHRIEAVLTGKNVRRKPCCVLSFDDGWLDFYKHARPVLLEENVPAVVYLPTALIGSDEVFWTDRLARLLEDTGERNYVATHLNKLVNGKNTILSPLTLRNLDRAITLLKQHPYQEIEKLLAACEAEADISSQISDRSFMNWNEVRELYDTGLISFGSHTVHHAILTTLPPEERAGELLASREKLQQKKVNGDTVSFCYPNGNYNAEIAQQVRECGYSSAMTCDSGWNRKGEDQFLLKRVSMHQDVSFTEPLFAYRLNQFF